MHHMHRNAPCASQKFTFSLELNGHRVDMFFLAEPGRILGQTPDLLCISFDGQSGCGFVNFDGKYLWDA